MFFDSLILYFIAGLGCLAIAGAVFWMIFSNYEKIETTVLEGMSNYASEIYDLLDRMFLRRPMNQVYLMILVPTILFGLIGFTVGLLLSGFISSILLAGVLGTMGFKLPGTFIRARFDARVVKFDK